MSRAFGWIRVVRSSGFAEYPPVARTVAAAWTVRVSPDGSAISAPTTAPSSKSSSRASPGMRISELGSSRMISSQARR